MFSVYAYRQAKCVSVLEAANEASARISANVKEPRRARSRRVPRVNNPAGTCRRSMRTCLPVLPPGGQGPVGRWSVLYGPAPPRVTTRQKLHRFDATTLPVKPVPFAFVLVYLPGHSAAAR